MNINMIFLEKASDAFSLPVGFSCGECINRDLGQLTCTHIFFPSTLKYSFST